MEKYQQFQKLSNTSSCSIYCAINRQSGMQVIMVRLPQKGSWDDLLSNRNFIFSSKDKIFPKVVEVFKRKRHFFIVFERPAGKPLSEPELTGKLDQNRFFPIFADLCQGFARLKKFKSNMWVQPEWVIVGKNSVKICHFEPFFDSIDQVHNHVFMYNLEKRLQGEQPGLITAAHKEQFIEKNKDVVFNLGCMAYSMLTGLPASKATTAEDYLKQMNELAQSSKRRVLKATSDEKLADMVSKMVGKNPFEAPKFQHVLNYAKRQAQLVKPKHSVKPLEVQFEMQKIQLTRFKQTKKRKFTRPCCKTFEDEDLQAHSHYFSRRDVSPPYSKKNQKRAKSIFPELGATTNRHRLRYYREASIKSTHFQKPTAFMSQDHINFKEI